MGAWPEHGIVNSISCRSNFVRTVCTGYFSGQLSRFRLARFKYLYQILHATGNNAAVTEYLIPLSGIFLLQDFFNFSLNLRHSAIS